MDTARWVEILILVLCLLIAAISAAAETALTSVSRIRVRYLAEEGSRQAAILQRLRENPNQFLTTILVTNTVSIIVASIAATLLISSIFPSSSIIVGIVGSIVLSVAVLVLAEVTPKTVAVNKADKFAIALAAPVELLTKALSPFVYVLGALSRLIVRPGIRSPLGPYVSEEELQTLLNISEESGILEEEEREMIHGIIEIGDKPVREVMTPRPDIIAVSKDATLADVANTIQKHGFTRLPVYEGDLDHIIGIVHAKDVLRLYAKGSGKETIAPLIREVVFVPESRKVDEVLQDMRNKQVHMMIVLDEYGSTAGLVTLEDLIEEIVGEIRDEYDTSKEAELQFPAPNVAVVTGRFPLKDLVERLGIDIETDSGEYDSVGGFVFSKFGTVPHLFDTFEAAGAKWTVIGLEGHRITRVRIERPEAWPDESPSDKRNVENKVLG
jgi:putative hemolysin